MEERVLPVLQLRLTAVLVVYLPNFDEFGPQLVFQDLQFGGIQYFLLHLFDSGVLLSEDTFSRMLESCHSGVFDVGVESRAVFGLPARRLIIPEQAFLLL